MSKILWLLICGLLMTTMVWADDEDGDDSQTKCLARIVNLEKDGHDFTITISVTEAESEDQLGLGGSYILLRNVYCEVGDEEEEDPVGELVINDDLELTADAADEVTEDGEYLFQVLDPNVGGGYLEYELRSADDAQTLCDREYFFNGPNYSPDCSSDEGVACAVGGRVKTTPVLIIALLSLIALYWRLVGKRD